MKAKATQAEEQRAKVLPVDALAEDLFGLNVRGLKSVRLLWINPRRYFEAARTIDWESIYTPSIRLWLSFFALYSLLKFWWIGGNAGMIGAFSAGFAQAGLNLPDGMTFDDVGKEAALWVFGLVPVLQIICMVVLSLIYPFWGERTTMALRQRYLFAVIVPSSSLMPIVMTAMVFVPAQWLVTYGILLAVMSFTVDFQTGLRGAFQQKSRYGKVWRAGLLAIIVVMLNVLVSVGAQIAGIMVTASKYGVAAPA